MKKKKYLYQIYKITNLINNKVYIGLTVQGAQVRFYHHLYEARSNSPFPIHRAIRKYGVDNFKLDILETLENADSIKDLEKYYIAIYDSNNRKLGYNLTAGGDGTIGRLHSQETKDKIAEKAKGRKTSIEIKEKMSQSHQNHEAIGLPARKEIKVIYKDKTFKVFRSLTKAQQELNIAKETMLKYINKNNGIYKDYIFELIA